MANVEIEMNFAGLVDLMKSPEIVSVLESEARRRTEATGMTYKPDVYPNGKTRANAAGFQKGSHKTGTEDQDYPVCPKCGHSHPNCNCHKRKG